MAVVFVFGRCSQTKNAVCNIKPIFCYVMDITLASILHLFALYNYLLHSYIICWVSLCVWVVLSHCL